MLNRVVYNILCKDIPTSVAFYQALEDFEVVYESDWYVVLTPSGQPNVQLGLIDQVSEFTPRHARGNPQGGFITLVVSDVFATLERARKLGVEIITEPMALEYGQTRVLIREPNGFVLDISTPTEDLKARGNVDFVGIQRTVAIDQQQPEDRGGPMH